MASKEEKRAIWIQRVADQRASGLTASAWCREQGIHQPSLHYWLKQLPPTDAADALSCAPQWLSMAMDSLAPPGDRASDSTMWTGPGSCPTSCLTLRIGHVSIDIAPDFDPHLLCRVLRVLEARC